MMKRYTLAILVVAMLCSAGKAAAAPGEVGPDSGTVAVEPALYTHLLQDPGLPGKSSFAYHKNNFKINLSSLLLNNYSLSYERSVTRKISLVAGYRFMPETALGSMAVTRNIIKNLDVDSQISGNLNNFRTSNKAYTGEVRVYGGRKPGARGLYLSLYGRYTTMTYDIDVSYAFEEKTYNFPIRSEVAGIGGGLMLGYQWLIADRMVLDFYFIGGHYGKLTKGDFNTVADINPEHKSRIKEELEDLGTIGSTRYVEATVTDKGVQATVNGPFFGVRGFGINLGIAF